MRQRPSNLKEKLKKTPTDSGKFHGHYGKDFGKDFSAQTRDEWRQVKLTNWGRSLSVKEWRTFKVQWEVAAMRVEDKREKEEYELLYDQLSSYWQEKMVKKERTQKEHKYCLRIGRVKGLKRRDLMDLLDEEELKYQRVVEQGNWFNIQCNNDEEVSRALEMDGLQISNQPLRVTRTNKSKVKDIFHFGRRTPEN
jgi:hypothetical protein